MHIKVERFLTLTAMLATTQVGVVGCGDDGTGSEPGDDAGRSDAMTQPATDSTNGNATSVDGGTSDETGKLNASLDTKDSGVEVPDAAIPGDGGVETAIDAGDASADSGDIETSWADTGSAMTWTDAGGETPWGDTSDEAWALDAGGEGCLAGDFAEESTVAACFATFESCDYSYARDLCSIASTHYRAGIVETFWDCYVDANIGDPCSENADNTASSCHSFAIENALLCEEPFEECEGVVEDCSEVTLESCQASLSQYNSGRREASVYCFDAQLANQAGPDYEGCGYDFTNCVYSPSVE